MAAVTLRIGQGKENIQDFDSSTQLYIKLSLLMTIFEASHFVQYLNNKLFSIKAEGAATRDRNTALSIDPSHNYTLNASFI